MGTSARMNGFVRRLKLTANGLMPGPGPSSNIGLGYVPKVVPFMRYRLRVRSKTPKATQTVSRCSHPIIRAPAHHFHALWWPEGPCVFSLIFCRSGQICAIRCRYEQLTTAKRHLSYNEGLRRSRIYDDPTASDLTTSIARIGSKPPASARALNLMEMLIENNTFFLTPT